MTGDDDVLGSQRSAELAANLEQVEARVVAACAAAGRTREDVTVIAVTKTFPVEDVMRLAALGVTDVGENRAAEAQDKERACQAAGVSRLRWHHVGQVQTNKAGVVAGFADVVHSVDRVRLVDALAGAADRVGRELVCLVQVDLREPAGDDGRGGAAPRDVAAVAAAIEAARHLRLGGVMAVAPLTADPGDTERAFARLAEVSASMRADHPHASIVSAGMSGDLEAAIAHGATHLRVGTALLGSRPSLG